MAISIASNFRMSTAEPIDIRYAVQSFPDLSGLLVYEGLECWVVEDKIKYRYTDGEWVVSDNEGDPKVFIDAFNEARKEEGYE